MTTSLIITGSVAAALFLAPLAPASGDTLPTDPAPSDTAVAVPADTPVPTPTDTPVPAPTETPVPAPTDPTVPPVAPVAPVAPAPDPDAPPPLVMPAALGSWCETLYPPTSAKTEKRKAQELMAAKSMPKRAQLRALVYAPNENQPWPAASFTQPPL